MYIQQLYTYCLTEATYYIESDGEAAVVDPFKDIEAYITIASERKAIIKYIFETHLHADFVGGHSDLSKSTGAPTFMALKLKQFSGSRCKRRSDI